VLIVDDEESIARLIADALKRHGYDCDMKHDGDSALDAAAELLPDLIILDVMLPRLDGFEVARRLKDDRETRDIPIIMLTARREEEDALAGFSAGASDYVRKPFSLAELAARVGILMRRGRPSGDACAVEIGPLRVDPSREEAFKDGERLDLSVTEYRLLETLACAGGRTVSRDELLRRVWNMQAGDTRTIDVHIYRLRRKIEENPEHPEMLHTIRGRGYRLGFLSNPAKNTLKTPDSLNSLKTSRGGGSR
jgi:two-component system phosphate regulon response regulator PhoB/two-component system alkaline phosphatase synthesis response regulator PhoP